MLSLILVSLLLSLQPTAPDELEPSALAYWKAIAEGNPAAALAYVHPDDLNHFLKRKPPTFTDWNLDKIEMINEKRARVTVTIDRLFSNGVHLPDDVREIWEWSDGKWLLRVKSGKELLAKQFAPRPEASLPAELAVFPKVLRFYKITPDQPASLLIQNGLKSPVDVVRLEWDESLFELLERPARVEARSRERIFLSYKGPEDGENLKSELTLILKEATGTREFRIPVIYNYFDAASRWFLNQPKPAPTKSPHNKPR